ncbi:hypothetical protein PRIPAC_77467 [Pristionchus pacificus]|uniref:ShK domain-containing protein n=1 Tax=Pristionchus pacificus TaxID=54126 RepID=A0A2A6CJT7_PRIPA|nr:hypothetical protein PRIPAC_77467 [Pristionchus pacificus]|eukprot:PDM78389.1 ShK domain-containing protein [Pristionchus pacificus]
MTFLPLLIGILSLASVIEAQCAASDSPTCPTWVANGFCSNPFYAKSALQKFCPKACLNSGCPSTCTTPLAKGFVSIGIKDCGVGYEVDSTGTKCCPIVDYMNPIWNYGPAMSGYCPLGSIIVNIPGGTPTGDCISLDSIPGICAVAVQDAWCDNGACRSGFTCFKKAGICCPSA